MQFLKLGQWHCVKRQLPECGRYDLEGYLPVYLWKKHCEVLDKDPFWELLRLLSKHQELFTSYGVSENVSF